MPELPEVETIARQLRERGVAGEKIRSATVRWERTVEPLSSATFVRRIRGCTINEISRYGKWMMFSLSSGQTIMIHLRMAGSFSMEPGNYDRIILELANGLKLYYRDTRKFGRWKLVDDPQGILSKLGPDALTPQFTKTYFSETLGKRQRRIKPLILDQSIVAGLGNIYADEALWRASIHPERLSNSLTEEDRGTLFRSIRHVLRIGVRNNGTSLGDGKTNYRDVEGQVGGHREEVKAYGKSGQPCERCKSTLIKVSVAQRGTTYCPCCQVI
jgi:formamidopyrimidine-DNA glycosylase